MIYKKKILGIKFFFSDVLRKKLHCNKIGSRLKKNVSSDIKSICYLFWQITFRKKFLAEIAMPLKILIKNAVVLKAKYFSGTTTAKTGQQIQDCQDRTEESGQQLQIYQKNVHTAKKLFSHCPKTRQIFQCLWEQQVTQRPTFQIWRGDDA